MFDGVDDYSKLSDQENMIGLNTISGILNHLGSLIFHKQTCTKYKS